MDDRELLRDYAKTGSEAAFAELVHRRLDLVHSAALRQVRGDPHRAREITQTVFTLLARKADSLSRHRALSGWLYTTTYHVARRLLRTERRRWHHEGRAMNEAGFDHPEPTAPWDELRPVLDEAMHELPENERTALVLRFFEQRSTAEIGASLGLSESGARKGLERALDRLRVGLGRRGITSTPAALALAFEAQAVSAAPIGLAVDVTGAAIHATVAPSVFLHLMSMTKLKVAAAVAVLLAAGAWISETRQLRTVQGQLDAAAAEQSRIDVALGAATRRARAARLALDRAAGAAIPDARPAESLPTTPGVTRERERADLDTSYSPLFRRLGLRDAELESLRDLLAERGVQSWAARRYVVVTTGRWMDEWADKTEELDYIAAGTREIDERIHALLGDDRYAYYANYERTLPWRARFLDLAKVLRSVDPLTDEQIDSLVTWTAEASPHLFTSHSKGDPRLPEGLLDRARSILSPLQQRKLQEAQAADAAQLALDRIAEATQ